MTTVTAPAPVVELARRPAHGQTGAAFAAKVNCYNVTPPTATIFHFDIIKPTEPKLFRRRRQDIINKLQVHVEPRSFRPLAVYDGQANLFAFHDVLSGHPQKTWEVNMSERAPVLGQPSRGLFSVTITRAQQLTNANLKTILEGTAAGVPIATTMLQALNVLVQQSSKDSREFTAHTRFASYTERRKERVDGLEIVSGFFKSIRPTMNRLYINIDTVTGILYQSGQLIDVVLSFLKKNNLRDIETITIASSEWQKLKSFLKGLRLQQESTGKVRKVSGIVDQAGRFRFHLKDGTEITVQDYFRTMKNRPLRFPDLPGIVCSTGEIVPFELLSVLPGQFYRKRLSPDMMTKVLNFSKKKPEDRFRAIQEGTNRLALHTSPYMVQSGMTIAQEPMQIMGRVLRPPTLQYGTGTPPINPKNGAWNLLNTNFNDPQKIYSWGVISFDIDVSQEQLKVFTRNLYLCMKDLGMGIADPQPPLHIRNAARVEQELMEVALAAVNSRTNQANIDRNKRPTLLVVVLQDNTADVKKLVKRWGDIHNGVPTQCIKGSKLHNANDQYFRNVCLKINAKLGGVNLIPIGNDMQWFQNSKVMTVGIDVSHPGPNVLRPSMVGVVASLDRGASKYVATTSIQQPRAEIVEDLQGMLERIIPMFNQYRAYIKEPDSWPEHLIVFRDGVSEGELHRVVELEFSQIKAAVKAIWTQRNLPFHPPKITLIIVGKRHHIRFAPSQSGTGDRSGNCPAGFIVDNNITAPGVYDFYLQSQAGLLGTSRPSHYIVVKDEIKFPPDILQSLCFTLCHTYARATRSVSIPAPVYYADIVCERADYHFDPTLRFTDETSSTGSESFDMKKWRDGYRPINAKISRNMYFM